MINGNLLKDMFISGSHNICNQKEPVNALNVFPVPDGDTGTNMSMTFTAAEKELALHSDKTAGEIAGIVANALLKGARGNSGVILSLLFRGFAKGMKDCDEADGYAIAAGFDAGVKAAYQAVMKPTEGTILTVAREAAEKTMEFVKTNSDATEVMAYYIEQATETLNRTPEMLPVLKQAGVVDAGGKGFLVILEGMLHTLRTGQVIEGGEVAETPETVDFADFNKFDTEEIVFAYCTEFIINKDLSKKRKVATLRSYLESIGDCVVAVENDEIIKVHVHTNHPGRAIEEALKFGMLATLKVENMKLQHEANIAAQSIEPAPVEMKPYAFVSVCAGEGITAVFKDLGIDEIVGGGQTMNPSTEDILAAVERAPSETVFILPNNKNIILSAEQCVELTDKKVIIIPTRTIPQGISAMLGFSPEQTAEENEAAMNESVSAVKTAHITYAARDSVFDGNEIKEGQLLGLLENKVSFVEDDIVALAVKLVEPMVDEYTAYISLFYGEGTNAEEAEVVRSRVQELAPAAEVVTLEGGQPVYSYIISVE
ncbi:MAG: DAK2 domain-containing protein [Clostridia bacterium]|nr:DAK2 domain-containing protein [Clostridia bacterium]